MIKMKTIILLTSWLVFSSTGTAQYYNLSNNKGSSTEPQVVVDSKGNVHFVWVDNTAGKSEIYYAVYGSQTPEHAMINLGSISGTSDSCNHPRMAVDSSGKIVYVVWEEVMSTGKSAIICASFTNPILAVNSPIVKDTISAGLSASCYRPDITMVNGAPLVCWASGNSNGQPPFNGKLYFTFLNFKTGNWMAPIFIADSVAINNFGYGNFWGRVTSAFNGTVFWKDEHGMNAQKNLMAVGPMQNHVVSSNNWFLCMKEMEVAYHGTTGNEKVYILYHGDGTTCNCDEPLEFFIFDGSNWSGQLIAYSQLEQISWGGFSLAAISDSDIVIIYEKLQWNGTASADTFFTLRYDGVQLHNLTLLPNVAGFSEPSIAASADGNLWMAFSGASGNGNADIFVYGSPITSVHRPSVGIFPTDFLLEQNYPNPFNPTTIINYRLPMNSLVTLKLYDVVGREVAVLVDGKQTSGEHSIVFDASQLPSGVYFYRLTAGNFSAVKKLVVIK